MKRLLFIIPALLLNLTGYAQKNDSLNAIGSKIQKAYLNNPDSIRALADTAVKLFTWDIKNVAKGTLMFLDVPYMEAKHDSAEYLTLTVAKEKVIKRPAFISVIVPNNVVQASGITIKFSNTKRDGSGDWQIVMDNAEPAKVEFVSCSEEQQTCTARIIGGFLTDERTGEKIDIFQKFMDFDHVYFTFAYPDGSHKSVGVPLFSFKEQYKALK